MDPLSAITVKALYQEGTSGGGKAFQLRLRHIEAAFSGQVMHYLFPGTGVMRVIFCRELCDPERAVWGLNSGFGPCPAERGARSQQLIQPLFLEIIIALLKGTGGRLQFSEGDPRWGRERLV